MSLENGKLIQQYASGERTAFDYGDLLVNTEDPAAFGAMARQAMTTGEPMNSMQHGEVCKSACCRNRCSSSGRLCSRRR